MLVVIRGFPLYFIWNRTKLSVSMPRRWYVVAVLKIYIIDWMMTKMAHLVEMACQLSQANRELNSYFLSARYLFLFGLSGGWIRLLCVLFKLKYTLVALELCSQYISTICIIFWCIVYRFDFTNTYISRAIFPRQQNQWLSTSNSFVKLWSVRDNAGT